MVNIKINTGNAAFQDEGEGNELARILRELADMFEGNELPERAETFSI